MAIFIIYPKSTNMYIFYYIYIYICVYIYIYALLTYNCVACLNGIGHHTFRYIGMGVYKHMFLYSSICCLTLYNQCMFIYFNKFIEISPRLFGFVEHDSRFCAWNKEAVCGWSRRSLHWKACKHYEFVCQSQALSWQSVLVNHYNDPSRTYVHTYILIYMHMYITYLMIKMFAYSFICIHIFEYTMYIYILYSY